MNSKKKITLSRIWARYYYSFKYGFSLRKPRLLFRIIYNYLYLLFFKKPLLRYVDLAVTLNCNLNCIHCSASRMLTPGERTMNNEDYAKLSQQLVHNGVLIIQLTGGEPLFRPGIEELIKALNPSRFFLSMGTNTSFLNPERAQLLKKIGVDNLCISIDDWDSEEHDRWRGVEGIHAHAIQAIEWALAAGLNVMVFTVATHQNVRSENFLKLVDFTGNKKILLLVGWAVPTGNWNGNEDVLLTPDDLEYLEEIHERHLHVRTDFESNYTSWGCGAVKEKLYITPYGDVIPCAFVHIKFGNIFEESLESIRERALKIPWFGNYNPLCLAANDRQFQKDHLSRIFEAKHEPISIKEAGFDIDDSHSS